MRWHSAGETLTGGCFSVSRAELVITPITTEGLSQAEAARRYGLSQARAGRLTAATVPKAPRRSNPAPEDPATTPTPWTRP